MDVNESILRKHPASLRSLVFVILLGSTMDSVASQGCSTWAMKALDMWQTHFAEALYWRGEKGVDGIYRLGDSYPMTIRCATNTDGQVTGVAGIHELPRPSLDSSELLDGQPATLWVLELIPAVEPDGRPLDEDERLRTSSGYCRRDRNNGGVLTFRCRPYGALTGIDLDKTFSSPGNGIAVTLELPRNFQPKFMKPGPEKDRILELIGNAIKKDILDEGWKEMYPGGQVEVLVRDFGERPSVIDTLYWHPPWKSMVMRVVALAADGKEADMYMHATRGISPNQSFSVMETDLSAHYLRRLRENAIHLTISLSDEPSVVLGGH